MTLVMVLYNIYYFLTTPHWESTTYSRLLSPFLLIAITYERATLGCGFIFQPRIYPAADRRSNNLATSYLTTVLRLTLQLNFASPHNLATPHS